MKRDAVLARLAEQIANWWQADAFEPLSNVGLHEFSRVPGENKADCMAHLEGAVDGQVQGNGRPGRI